jgi:hypothetical protein
MAVQQMDHMITSLGSTVIIIRNGKISIQAREINVKRWIES